MKTRALAFCLLFPVYDLASATGAATPPLVEPMTPPPGSALLAWETPLIEAYEYLLGTMLAGEIIYNFPSIVDAWDARIKQVNAEYERSLDALFPTPESRESEGYVDSKGLAITVDSELRLIGRMLCILRVCEAYGRLSADDCNQLVVSLRGVLLSYDELKNSRGFEARPDAWWDAQQEDFRRDLALLVIPVAFDGFSQQALGVFGCLLGEVLLEYDESFRARSLVTVTQIMTMLQGKGIIKDTYARAIVMNTYRRSVTRSADETVVATIAKVTTVLERGRSRERKPGRYRRSFSA